MHNAVYFPEPDKFKPERFLKHGVTFANDPRVCNFSLGKRNCVGKHIAQTFYFEIVASIIVNFKLECDDEMISDTNVGSINVPREFKMKFLPRSCAL